MIIVFGQYHSSLLAKLDAMQVPYELLKDAKRYADELAVDFSDESAVLAAARRIASRPSAIIAMYEQYIPLAAKISAQLGITHSLSYEAAINATDKVSMRRAFDATAGISPAHAEVSDIQDARDFVERYGYPVIVKPANLSKSMLISRCDSDTELDAAFASIRSLAPELYKKYTLDQTPKFIIEQFMMGSIHTLAAFIDANGTITYAPGIVDNVSAREAGYDDTFIYRRSLPTRLHTDQQNDAYDCATKSIQALGLRSCPAHVEIIMTPAGARVIEIGARLGGYRPLMYELSCGVDLIEAAVKSYLGESVIIENPRDQGCAVIELFPTNNGAITRLDGFDKIAELESFYKIRKAKSTSDQAGRAADGHKAIGYVVLAHQDQAVLERDTQAMARLFKVDLES